MKKVNYKKAVVGFADMAFSFMPFALTLAFSVSLYSCSEYNAKSMACKTARNSVNFTVNDPSLKILDVSTPDSVIDGCMFSEQDKKYLMNLITESSNDVFASLYEENDTDKLIEKFNSLTASTYDTSRLAQEIMIQSVRRPQSNSDGRLTGWCVKVIYETTINGKNVKMERWCYLDPSGTSVVKSFDIPRI